MKAPFYLERFRRWSLWLGVYANPLPNPDGFSQSSAGQPVRRTARQQGLLGPETVTASTPLIAASIVPFKQIEHGFSQDDNKILIDLIFYLLKGDHTLCFMVAEGAD